MKRYFVLVLALSIGHSLHSQQNDWEDQHITGYNKEKPHATFIPYQDESSALTFNREKSGFFMSLNGTWKFRWVPDDDQRPKDFYLPGADVSDWDSIPRTGRSWDTVSRSTPI
jgi:beta-galactosidase